MTRIRNLWIAPNGAFIECDEDTHEEDAVRHSITDDRHYVDYTFLSHSGGSFGWSAFNAIQMRGWMRVGVAEYPGETIGVFVAGDARFMLKNWLSVVKLVKEHDAEYLDVSFGAYTVDDNAMTVQYIKPVEVDVKRPFRAPPELVAAAGHADTNPVEYFRCRICKMYRYDMRTGVCYCCGAVDEGVAENFMQERHYSYGRPSL